MLRLFRGRSNCPKSWFLKPRKESHLTSQTKVSKGKRTTPYNILFYVLISCLRHFGAAVEKVLRLLTPGASSSKHFFFRFSIFFLDFTKILEFAKYFQIVK